jgi:hypothetical protein
MLEGMRRIDESNLGQAPPGSFSSTHSDEP